MSVFLEQNFAAIIKIASLVLALISGVGLVPLVAWLKTALNTSGRWSQLMTAVVAVIFSLANMLVTQQITPEMATGEHFVELFLAVLTVSQAEYARLKRLVP